MTRVRNNLNNNAPTSQFLFSPLISALKSSINVSENLSCSSGEQSFGGRIFSKNSNR